MIRNYMYRVSIVLLLFGYGVEAKEQQLCMFIHQHDTLTDEEGMNVTHQFLTALIQKACPVLISQTLWEHVEKRKQRFDMHTDSSRQSDVIRLHEVTNKTIQQHNGNHHAVHQALNNQWFYKHFEKLASLDQEASKVLLFDYFCSKFHELLEGWNTFYLPEGYFLLIPQKNKEHYFCIDDVAPLDKKELFSIKKNLSKAVFHVLRKYICSDDIEWSFYLTGHGYHKDEEHNVASIAGMKLSDFQQLLLTLNSRSIRTKILTYSSCYSAGEHALVPYRFDDKDMLLKYPVLMISCVDAPTYVFGVPAGMKLPPYNKGNVLAKSDVESKRLQWHVMQNFHEFVSHAKKGLIGRKLAYAVSPYVHCQQDICDVAKVENLPVLRKAGQLHFMPLDESLVCMVQQHSKKHIDVGSKSAVMLYTKKYPGEIILTSKLPAFISMLPGSQVHCIAEVVAQHHTFTQFITSCFMMIEDDHEQNIYLFDKVRCHVDIMSDKHHTELQNVVVVPSGPWVPKFAHQDAALYVYAQIGNQSYWISFDHHRQIVSKVLLRDKQLDTMHKFIRLLQQQCSFGDSFSMKQLLSTDHFMQKTKLQDQLLQQCLQDLICRDIE